MPVPSNYPEELRERAVRLYREFDPRPTIRRLAEQLKVPPETLRSWIHQDQAGRGERNHRPSAATHTPQARGGQMVAVMRMTGELDRAALDALEHTATEHFTAGASTVVIDFAAVTAFPSALFTRLHQLDTRARAHRRRLRLVHLDQAVRTMISQLRASPDLPTPASKARNGVGTETVLTEIGPVQIEVPHDRDASFDPVIVRKRQRD